MKYNLPSILVLICSATFFSTLMAEESTEGGSNKMSIEQIVENCEQQYNEQNYPDVEERNKLVDQCIDENSASLPVSPQ